MRNTVCGSSESWIKEVLLLGYSLAEGNHNAKTIFSRDFLVNKREAEESASL